MNIEDQTYFENDELEDGEVRDIPSLEYCSDHTDSFQSRVYGRMAPRRNSDSIGVKRAIRANRNHRHIDFNTFAVKRSINVNGNYRSFRYNRNKLTWSKSFKSHDRRTRDFSVRKSFHKAPTAHRRQPRTKQYERTTRHVNRNDVKSKSHFNDSSNVDKTDEYLRSQFFPDNHRQDENMKDDASRNSKIRREFCSSDDDKFLSDFHSHISFNYHHGVLNNDNSPHRDGINLIPNSNTELKTDNSDMEQRINGEVEISQETEVIDEPEVCDYNENEVVIENSISVCNDEGEVELQDEDDASCDKCTEIKFLSIEELTKKIEQSCKERHYRNLRYYTSLYVKQIGFNDRGIIKKIIDKRNVLNFKRLKKISLSIMEHTRDERIRNTDDETVQLEINSTKSDKKKKTRKNLDKQELDLSNGVNNDVSLLGRQMKEQQPTESDETDSLLTICSSDKSDVGKADDYNARKKILLVNDGRKSSNSKYERQYQSISADRGEKDVVVGSGGEFGENKYTIVENPEYEDSKKKFNYNSSDEILSCGFNENNLIISKKLKFENTIRSNCKGGAAETKLRKFNCDGLSYKRLIKLFRNMFILSSRTLYRMKVSRRFRYCLYADLLRSLMTVIVPGKYQHPGRLKRLIFSAFENNLRKYINNNHRNRQLSDSSEFRRLLQLKNTDIFKDNPTKPTSTIQVSREELSSGDYRKLSLLQNVENSLLQSRSRLINHANELESLLRNLETELLEKDMLYKRYDLLVSSIRQLRLKVRAKETLINERHFEILNHYRMIMKRKQNCSTFKKMCLAVGLFKTEYKVPDEYEQELSGKLDKLTTDMRRAVELLNEID